MALPKSNTGDDLRPFSPCLSMSSSNAVEDMRRLFVILETRSTPLDVARVLDSTVSSYDGWGSINNVNVVRVPISE